MDPITLHFNVFQAGATPEARTSLQVDPRVTTVGALKKQLFPDQLKERKSVRFIAGGHILDDASLVSRCQNLKHEAHVHVSISDKSASIPSSEPGSPAGGSSPVGGPAASGAASGAAEPAATPIGDAAKSADCTKVAIFFLMCAFFVGSVAVLHNAWLKRWQLTMHASQLLSIFAAVLVYVLIFHALPALPEAFSALARVAAGATNLKAYNDMEGVSGLLAAAAASPAALVAAPLAADVLARGSLAGLQ